ncbi:hypothetical protein [Mycoplasma sp. 'Moose RK']|uniref:hypothetical protein n=1 Tax=Mycoplasma sp. 'Moose RK' TaxID=2780095 RepID=UPI0018C302D0|nr:hypothetical protein [Mycoplasma sp. 'Moose RK']MBG0730596.1 hypothetical protein [Mycoplasma sp. 'Moose RK']
MATKNTRYSNKIIDLSDPNRLLEHKIFDENTQIFTSINYTFLFSTKIGDKFFGFIFDEYKNVGCYEYDPKTKQLLEPIEEFDDEIIDQAETVINDYFHEHEFVFEGKKVLPKDFFNNEMDEIEQFRDDSIIDLDNKKEF